MYRIIPAFISSVDVRQSPSKTPVNLNIVFIRLNNKQIRLNCVQMYGEKIK